MARSGTIGRRYDETGARCNVGCPMMWLIVTSPAVGVMIGVNGVRWENPTHDI